MATRIIEYDASGHRQDGLQAVPTSIVVQTPLTASGMSQASAPMSAATTLCLVQSDEPVHITREAAAATTSNYKIPAGGEQFFTVVPTMTIKVLLGT